MGSRRFVCTSLGVLWLAAGRLGASFVVVARRMRVAYVRVILTQL